MARRCTFTLEAEELDVEIVQLRLPARGRGHVHVGDGDQPHRRRFGHVAPTVPHGLEFDPGLFQFHGYSQCIAAATLRASKLSDFFRYDSTPNVTITTVCEGTPSSVWPFSAASAWRCARHRPASPVRRSQARKTAGESWFAS